MQLQYLGRVVVGDSVGFVKHKGANGGRVDTAVGYVGEHVLWGADDDVGLGAFGGKGWSGLHVETNRQL